MLGRLDEAHKVRCDFITFWDEKERGNASGYVTGIYLNSWRMETRQTASTQPSTPCTHTLSLTSLTRLFHRQTIRRLQSPPPRQIRRISPRPPQKRRSQRRHQRARHLQPSREAHPSQPSTEAAPPHVPRSRSYQSLHEQPVPHRDDPDGRHRDGRECRGRAVEEGGWPTQH
jgi:hypothetical protein